jgi:NADP-dependent 3-hydroxy acid dehydrogenase YdfG
VSISLQDRIVFVTGASSGIGRATAETFARQGARLLLAARRRELLQARAPELTRLGAAAVPCLELDVSRPGDVSQSMAALPAGWQAVDVLVNNAGLSRGLEKLWKDELRNWEEMIDTNIKGLLYVTRAVLPGMIERNRGHVINLGSVAGDIAYAGGAVYCGTKAAVRLINDGLRIDVLGTAVRVTAIDPGMVETEFSQVRFRGDGQRAARVYQNITPLAAADVADAILWAATRPPHVNIGRMLITTIDQANAVSFHRHE